jgi:hypothetical protein
MNLKKIKIIGTITIFALAFIYHFLYECFPNPIFSILFPVNESIWEHMKLLYTGILSWGLIEIILLKKNKINYNNYPYQLFLTAFTSIIIYLILYLPIHNLIGEKLIISILLLFIVILLEQILSYYLLKQKKETDILDKISIILIILFYMILLNLTYDPPRSYIFYDNIENKYGINIK